MKFTGIYTLRHYRKGKLLRTTVHRNAVTDEGLTYILDVACLAGGQTASWYIGLINYNSGLYALLDNDTMDNHIFWTELTTYDEATRPAWTPVVIGTATILNSSPAEFTINAPLTLGGIFLVSDDVKGGTAGVLLSTASINGLSYAAADVIKVQYQLQASR